MKIIQLIRNETLIQLIGSEKNAQAPLVADVLPNLEGRPVLQRLYACKLTQRLGMLTHILLCFPIGVYWCMITSLLAIRFLFCDIRDCLPAYCCCLLRITIMTYCLHIVVICITHHARSAMLTNVVSSVPIVFTHEWIPPYLSYAFQSCFMIFFSFVIAL